MSIIKILNDTCQHFQVCSRVVLMSKQSTMNSIMLTETKEILEAKNCYPTVSIILPFEPKMSLKNELTYALKIATDTVYRKLFKSCTPKMVESIMRKLKVIIEHLNFNTHKKSIAIYVSPVFEKVLYLDVEVEATIAIGDSFEIRNLIYNKKKQYKYLVLLLSGKESRVYLCNRGNLVRIMSNAPESLYAYINEIPERVANFSDISERKEIIMDKFLRHVDNRLGTLLHMYPLPLFVLGVERILGHFKSITRHASSIINYIHGNYQELSLNELADILAPYITDWEKIKQTDLLNHLEDAAGKNKLAVGIRDVLREAMKHRGRLLVMEKDYGHAEFHTNSEYISDNAIIAHYNKFLCVKNAVDNAIELVLENGGDVEFMDKDMLKNYRHIALVQYY